MGAAKGLGTSEGKRSTLNPLDKKKKNYGPLLGGAARTNISGIIKGIMDQT